MPSKFSFHPSVQPPSPPLKRVQKKKVHQIYHFPHNCRTIGVSLIPLLFDNHGGSDKFVGPFSFVLASELPSWLRLLKKIYFEIVLDVRGATWIVCLSPGPSFVESNSPFPPIHLLPQSLPECLPPTNSCKWDFGGHFNSYFGYSAQKTAISVYSYKKH